MSAALPDGTPNFRAFARLSKPPEFHWSGAATSESQPDFGAWAWEIHHSAKKDAPSGTLLQLVEGMQRSGYKRPVSVSSSRAGSHPGAHEIGFDSPSDTISLRHTARNREGFARGALLAAKWAMGRRGVYEFSDVLFG